MGTHTSFSLVVCYVCVGCFVVLSNWSVRFDCVPVWDDSVLYCRLYLWYYVRGVANTYCMRPSNDVDRDSKVDLTTLGVVTLDTTIVPDVFCLHAFDNRDPVVRVLVGAFSNMVRVLVPDAAATPVGFHDILVHGPVAPSIRP